MPAPNTPHVPTAAQLTQLASLQATATAAEATYQAAITSLASAKVAMQNALAASTQYSAYIYGGQKPGIYDEGGQSVT